jgi:hypothetical protein
LPLLLRLGAVLLGRVERFFLRQFESLQHLPQACPAEPNPAASFQSLGQFPQRQIRLLPQFGSQLPTAHAAGRPTSKRCTVR